MTTKQLEKIIEKKLLQHNIYVGKLRKDFYVYGVGSAVMFLRSFCGDVRSYHKISLNDLIELSENIETYKCFS